LLEDHAVAVDARALGSQGVKEIREERWAKALTEALAKVSADARRSTLKSAPWKVEVAAQLKTSTDVSNGWLAEQLDMGSGIYVSKHVGLLKRRGGA
jgi:hypothetical protein